MHCVTTPLFIRTYDIHCIFNCFYIKNYYKTYMIIFDLMALRNIIIFCHINM